MIEQPPTAPQQVNNPRVQDRMRGFWSSRRSKMFGLAEVAALAGSCLILLLVLLSYLYFLVPARARLDGAQAERSRLQLDLRKSQEILHVGNSTQKTVDVIAKSLNAFENNGLVRPEVGRMGLYDELNSLIVKNLLRNTSGPSYIPLEPAGARTNAAKSASTKWQSVYPGIAVTVTVEGQYQNIRHFIRDIENARQFIIINQVELQKATENNTPAAAAADAASGSRGSLISLQLNMATYFQRNNAQNGGAAVDPN